MRSVRRFAPTAIVLLLLSACASDEEKLADHMSRGDAYLEEEKWAEAIIEYKNVFQIDPNSAPAHWGLARAYLKSGKARDGFWELRETVRLDPDNLEARIMFGQLSVVAGELEEAIKQADAAIAADPQRIEAYLVKAQALDQLKRPEEVLAALEAARAIDPDHDATLALLAAFYAGRGDDESAEPILRRRAEANPASRSDPGLAAHLARTERYDEAEAAWRQALEVSEGTERARAYAQIAGFYYRQERFDEAKAVLEEGIAEKTEPLELIYLLARLHAARGEQAEADALIERATEAEPDNPRPYLVLSMYRGRKGDTAGALAAADDALRVDPNDEKARLRRAELLVEIGYRENDPSKIAEGRQMADAILAEEPTNAGALFVRAKIQMAESQVEEAIASLRQAIDARPDWAQAHFVLGTALALKGDKSAARTELARALEIDASLLDAHQVLAQVHASLGEHAYAVEEGRLYLRARPDAVPVHVLVAQSLVRLGRPEEALEQLESLPEDKQAPQVRYAMGRIRLAQGDLVGARKDLEAALAELPDNPDVLRNMLALDRREDRFDESLARINAAAERNPDVAALQRLRGQALLLAGQGAQAEVAFTRAVELDPNDVQSYQMLARYYAVTGKIEQTIQTYEKAVEVDPEAAHIHHFLGVLYESAGQRDKAIAAYKNAIERDPNLAESKNNLAYLYAESGRNLDYALDLAQEAKALLPDNANAADTLGWVLYRRGVPSAAITYLKEAEAGLEPGDPSLGIIRLHLAQAYQANEQSAEARATLERALSDLDTRRAQLQAEGQQIGDEPPWARDARSMLATL